MRKRTNITSVTSKKTTAKPDAKTRAAAKPDAKTYGKNASKSALSAVKIAPTRGRRSAASASEGLVRGELVATRLLDVQVKPVDVETHVSELFEGDIDGGEFVLIGLTSEKTQTFNLAQQLTKLLRARAQSAELFERAIEALMPPVEVPSAAATEQVRLNAKLRSDYFASIPFYTAARIATEAGSKAANKAQRASRLKREGRIFSLQHEGQTLFPTFQFDAHLNPKPVIAHVIAALESRGLSGWQVGLWFATNSAVLGGARPLELLDEDPERVIEAASREAP